MKNQWTKVTGYWLPVAGLSCCNWQPAISNKKHFSNLKYSILWSKLIVGVILIIFTSCEEDLKLDHISPSSDLIIDVKPETYGSGAIGDTVSYIIGVSSEQELTAVNIEPTITGEKNSGFDVSYNDSDPFADHRFGLLQKGYFNLEVKYKYIISVESGNINLTFNGSDKKGTSSKTVTLNVVPPIASYQNVVLYHKSNAQTDGFATLDGHYARNLGNYAIIGTEDQYVIDTLQTVQDKIDIIFIMKTEDDNAIITCPAGEEFDTGTTTWPKGKNQTVFKKLQSFKDSDFKNLTAAELIELTRKDSINLYGTPSVDEIKAFEYIGFITSFNSSNSYKLGIIKVLSVHQAAAPWYETPNQAMEMEIKVQYDYN